MSELENLIRQIVREEIELYFSRHQKGNDNESIGTSVKSVVTEDEIAEVVCLI
jgi:dihydroxyacetone kinase DhaKLM complex PTS-EIIA-like component DhaM